MNGGDPAMAAQSGAGGGGGLVELNVGGVLYTTSVSTLTSCAGSLLCQLFSGDAAGEPLLRDGKGRVFIDRDGVLFRYVLDFLRSQKLVLPENFQEADRLLAEAEYFQLTELEEALRAPGGRPRDVSGRSPGCILVGYRGTFAFGRDGLADVKFRKLARILVSGRVALCREAFGETLNESRDPDRGHVDRYTSRFFLKHSFLEQAFDMLYDAGFKLTASCGSGTASISGITDKPGQDSEENRWNHYNEFVFVRD